jgi:hypothetical protein
MQTRPGKKRCDEVCSLAEMGTMMRRKAASTYLSLRVVAGTETGQIPNRRQTL